MNSKTSIAIDTYDKHVTVYLIFKITEENVCLITNIKRKIHKTYHDQIRFVTNLKLNFKNIIHFHN